MIDAAAREAQVTVPDYQLSLAIGKEGQNARLAARLTGWRIDIRSDAQPTATAPPRGPGRAAAAPRRRAVRRLSSLPGPPLRRGAVRALARCRGRADAVD